MFFCCCFFRLFFVSLCVNCLWIIKNTDMSSGHLSRKVVDQGVVGNLHCD